MDLSVAQCRAARALLGWSSADLATAADLGIVTVKRFEGGQVINTASMNAIIDAFAAAGVAFIAAGTAPIAGGEGVQFAGG